MTVRPRSTRWLAGPLALLALLVVAGAASASTVGLTLLNGRTVKDPVGAGNLFTANTPIPADTPYSFIINRDVTSDPWQDSDAGTTTDGRPKYGIECRPGEATNGVLGADPNDAADDYPAKCNWASVHAIAGGTAASVVWHGTQDDVVGGTLTTTLPDGAYVLSLQADGYEVGGSAFVIWNGQAYQNDDQLGFRNGAVTDHAGATPGVNVLLQPNPLPFGTERIDVFEDNAQTNGEYDRDTENGLGGFRGIVTDIMGEAVTVDGYGNPICTDYVHKTRRVGNRNVDVLTADNLWAYQFYTDDTYTTPTDDYINGVPKPIPGTGGKCVSPAQDVIWNGSTPGNPIVLIPAGEIVIRNLEPGRYASTVSPPLTGPLGTAPTANGGGNQKWSQTSTLEGGHDWDNWVQAGWDGFDNERVDGSENVAPVESGWVRAQAIPTFLTYQGESPDGNIIPIRVRFARPGETGEIKGVAVEVRSYTPKPSFGTVIGSNEQSGQQTVGPVKGLWVSLNSLLYGDRTVYAGPANADGTFDITGVPVGDYSLAVWDFDQNDIIYTQNVTVEDANTANNVVTDGKVVDVDQLRLAQWWSTIDGYVFNDLNENGKRDPGEPGIPGFTLTLRSRDNSLFEQASNLVTTDDNGYYVFRAAYPLGQWVVEEAYSDGYRTTGYTYKTAQMKDPVTVAGDEGVDVNVLDWISQAAQVDWGKRPYADPAVDPNHRNGGIVGVVSYDTTRNELDPDEAAVEDWQPGVPGVNVYLYDPKPCAVQPPNPLPGDGSCKESPDKSRYYEVAADGSLALGNLSTVPGDNPYVTETWHRPTGCQAYDAEGNPTSYPFLAIIGTTGVLPDSECVEGIGLGEQVDKTVSAEVNGNWGFGPNLPPGDYIVKIELPNDESGSPAYQVTREEDINVFSGDSFHPSAPSPNILKYGCVGALHTVDVEGVGTDGYPATGGAPASTPTHNPTFAEQGGSPAEGTQTPLCDAKLVHLEDGRSIAPAFNVFTPVQLPGIHYGLLIDDLNISPNPDETLYGDKTGMVHMPVSWYDFAGRLVRQTVTDPNGFYEVMLPSTNRINNPSPSGVSAQVYRLVADDPTTPGPNVYSSDPNVDDTVRPNPNYDPGFRTISTPFQLYPGVAYVTDLALWPIGANVQGPGTTLTHKAQCLLDPAIPQLFAATTPLARIGESNGPGTVPADSAALQAARTITLTGTGFGDAQGQVTLDQTSTVRGNAQRLFGVSGATNGSPIRITTATPNGLATGDIVTIAGMTTDSAANGTWSVTRLNNYQFTLDGSTGNGAFGVTATRTVNGPFTAARVAGGTWTINLANHGFASGAQVVITGATPAGLNGTHTISNTNNTANSFRITDGPGGGTGTGSGNAAATISRSVDVAIATNDPTVQVTTIANHGFKDGTTVTIAGVAGNTAANGAHAIQVTGGTTFALPGVAGNGEFGTGGSVQMRDLITGASNAAPISITSPGHGLQTGNRVTVSGVAGNTAANGTWTVTRTGTNTFTLNNSGGNGAFATPTASRSVAIATATRNNFLQWTLTTGTAHGLATGASITVTGATGSPSPNGTYTVTGTPNATTLTIFRATAAGATWVGGTATHSAAISLVESTNPARIEAAGHGFANGAVVTISGVVGPAALNGTRTITRIDGNAFTVPVNAQALPAFVPASWVRVWDVTDASNATPIVVTVGAHPFVANDIARITGVRGNTAANGVHTVSAPSATGFALSGTTGDGAFFDTTTAPVQMEVLSWSATSITARVKLVANTDPDYATPGPHALRIVGANGRSTVNGLTVHLLGRRGPANASDSSIAYLPTLYTVNAPAPVANATGPGTAQNYLSIQGAINATLGIPRPGAGLDPVAPATGTITTQALESTRNDLVVVFPGKAKGFNPRGAYQENIIVPRGVKLQGVGAGGFNADGSYVKGSLVDGYSFGVQGNGEGPTDWFNLVNWLTDPTTGTPLWAGNTDVFDGEVIYVLSSATNYRESFKASIDGFAIEGGDQLDFNPNIAELGGGPVPRLIGGGVPATQGGGIFVNGYAHHLQITNNVFRSNGGAYGGAVRLGTPSLGGAGVGNGVGNVATWRYDSNHNDHVAIADNQIIGSGGTNLAGSIGIFNGADSYQVVRNDICGAFSQEYGAGISHYGYSPGGTIAHNRIYFNQSYDEGAGVMVAGNLPQTGYVSEGSGPVDIDGNIIQSNLSGDDGGGLRFLMAGNYPINVRNNEIVNNISAHEGGGIAIDDATDVRIVNDTIMKNLTTATAMTSNGAPMPAGISTGARSDGASFPNSPNMPALPADYPGFSRPRIVNDILWDNRAGEYDGNGGISGIGLVANEPLTYWDLGIADATAGALEPHNSIIRQGIDMGDYTAAALNNKQGAAFDPLVVSAYDTTVSVAPFRGDPHFVAGTIVALDVPPIRQGDYGLQSGSPAIDAGAASVAFGAPAAGTVTAPPTDIDGDDRPQNDLYDVGADETPTSHVGIRAKRGPFRTFTVSATVGGTRRAGPTQRVPAGRAPVALAARCTTCKVVLQVKRGKRIVKTVRMHLRKGTWTVTLRGLRPGTYRIRAVVTRTAHRGHPARTRWSTIRVTSNRKGAR